MPTSAAGFPPLQNSKERKTMGTMQKLWNPFRSFVRRTLPATCRFTTYSSNSHFQSSSSHLETSTTISPCPSYGHAHDFFGNSKLSAKSFCSQSASEVDPTIRRCWKCDAIAPESVPFFFCNSCSTIQPVEHRVDYFQIFGLERKFDIDFEDLDRKYKNLQKKLHPDIVHSKSEQERTYAISQSKRVIEANRTLTQPVARAKYMLSLEGVDADDEKIVTDLELLAEIIEIREAVQDTHEPQALNQLRSQMEEKLKQSYNSFVNAYESRNFNEAVTCTERMSYYSRAVQEISNKL